ncbi:hypothetical protein D3C84_978850 [compost metagenome]
MWNVRVRDVAIHHRSEFVLVIRVLVRLVPHPLRQCVPISLVVLDLAFTQVTLGEEDGVRTLSSEHVQQDDNCPTVQGFTCLTDLLDVSNKGVEDTPEHGDVATVRIQMEILIATSIWETNHLT